MKTTLNTLRFNFELLDRTMTGTPYPEHELWGWLWIDIHLRGIVETPFSTETSRIVRLFGLQWDLAGLAEWFVHHEQDLCTMPLPATEGCPALLHRESLAQALRRLAECESIDADQQQGDDWFDALYRFRVSHALCFALRGARMPDIIVGCKQNIGEISLVSLADNDADTEDWSYLGSWSYPFDMDDFRNDLRRKLRQIVLQWVANNDKTVVHERANGILERLPAAP